MRPYGNLTDDTCSAPCWHGITPGQTTSDDAMVILQNLDIVKTDSIKLSEQSWQGMDQIYWEFQHSGEGTISLINNVVYLIGFSSKPKNSMFDREEGLNLQFSQAIDKFGEPALIFSVFMEELTIYEEIWALYPEKGVNFYFSCVENSSEFQKELTPETPVNYVEYFSPPDYQKIKDMFIVKDTFSEEDEKYSTHPWRGYGSIKEKYPSRWGSKE